MRVADDSLPAARKFQAGVAEQDCNKRSDYADSDLINSSSKSTRTQNGFRENEREISFSYDYNQLLGAVSVNIES
jgi:hypothetical protein